MLEFKNISLSFNGASLIRDFNLSLGEGEKVLLDGPSGGGKSSLVKMALGFVRPDKGNVFLDGKVMSPKNARYFRENISYVSQDVDLREIEVRLLFEEIFSYKVNRRLAVDDGTIKHLMEEYSLNSDTLTKNVADLSGGERSRLGFVIAFLLDRRIWLLDEVTASLDKDLKEKVIATAAKSGKTVVAVSHDVLWKTRGSFKSVRWS